MKLVCAGFVLHCCNGEDYNHWRAQCVSSVIDTEYITTIITIVLV